MTAPKLRVAHLVSSASGGAAKAAYRLHLSLCNHEVDSHFFACLTSNQWPGVEWLDRSGGVFRRVWRSVEFAGKVILAATGRNRKEIDFQVIPQGYLAGLDAMGFDLVHFHWVDGSVASLSELAGFQTPIMWTLHDMRAFTGGYYYLGSHLTRWLESKGSLPAFDMDDHPLIRAVLAKKRSIYRGKKVAAIAPSRWMEDCVRESGMFPDSCIRRIPYEIPAVPWQEADRAEARRELGLPESGRIILFGADSLSYSRKGGDLLIEALSGIGADQVQGDGEIRVISFGGGSIPMLEGMPFAYQAFGRISDERRLAALYAAANVFVAPSREDNLPNVVLESLAAGTPVVAFDIGGMPDMITDGENGRLVRPFSVEGLREAVLDVVAWPADADMVRKCRDSVEDRFHPDRQREAVLSFYREFLSRGD
jgi:glycosyltransferase involved in cell wall biosynthesis